MAIITRILIGWENLWTRLDDRVIWHGDDSSYWAEQSARSRADYAKKNPWVLSYDFGHKELIERFSKVTVI